MLIRCSGCSVTASLAGSETRGQMLGLAAGWGVKGLDAFDAGLARDFLAAAADASKADAA